MRLAAELGDLEPYADVLGELRAERDRPKREIAESDPGHVIDPEVLRRAVVKRVGEFRTASDAAPEAGRRALAALLGDRRIQVHPTRRGSSAWRESSSWA